MLSNSVYSNHDDRSYDEPTSTDSISIQLSFSENADYSRLSFSQNQTFQSFRTYVMTIMTTLHENTMRMCETVEVIVSDLNASANLTNVGLNGSADALFRPIRNAVTNR